MPPCPVSTRREGLLSRYLPRTVLLRRDRVLQRSSHVAQGCNHHQPIYSLRSPAPQTAPAHMQAAETLPPDRPGGQPAPGAVTSPEIYGNRPEKGEKGGHPSGYMPGMAGPPVARDATVYPVEIGQRRTGTGPRHEGRRTTPISGHGFPTGCTPDTAAPLISPRTAPPPGRGGGGAPKAREGWGCRQKGMGISTEARARDAGEK